MHLTRLRFDQLRCFETVDIELAPDLNVFIGPNGAGKSSLIEAIHLLGYGRSFRGRVRDGLIRTGQPQLEVYAEWLDGAGQARRAGLRHTGSTWEARLDGATATSLSELCVQLAVVTFEPGSHELIGGSAEHRRRFMDWGLFHVEQEFMGFWRRYARALKQRNTLLKTQPGQRVLEPWNHELAQAGEALTRLRQSYLDRLEPVLTQTADQFLPELETASLEFRPGWKRDEMSLADALLLSRERDVVLGYTSIGPHRADWRLSYDALPQGEALSRGQEKLTALTCVLAQARAYAAQQGTWPIVCLDDLASELDRKHQQNVLTAILGCGAQILLTGTEAPWTSAAPGPRSRLFHVERIPGGGRRISPGEA